MRQIVADYVTLTKPKVQSLLLLTTVTTMYVAGDPSLALVFWTVLGGSLASGGAGAVNHYYDRDIDAQMARTATSRPVPAGRISPRAALSFGIALAALSFAELWLAVNLLAAVLALSGFLGYVFVYTIWLKRSTPQNIVIGGAAGAVPPLVAWAAVTGPARADRAVPVRDRLLLDAAALLGAVAADEGRVRARGRADDAGGARRGRDARADPALHRAARRAHADAGGVRLLRPALRRSPRSAWAAASSGSRYRLWREAERRSALRTYLFSLAYLAALFCAMVADARL